MPPNRKQRAAALRAVAAIGAKDEVAEEERPRQVSRQPAPPAHVQEATLRQALSGRLSRFEAVARPPDWLGAAFEPGSRTAKELHGALIVFHWVDYGWCVARLALGSTVYTTANFSAVYANEWREDHCLTLEAYSPSGPHGSWALLRPTRSGSPIVGYGGGGKYRKVVDGVPAWLRTSSDGLLHHTREELAAARSAKEERKADETQQAAEQELDTTGHAAGERLHAKGFDGRSTSWYRRRSRSCR